MVLVANLSITTPPPRSQCAFYCAFQCPGRCRNFRDKNGKRRCYWKKGKGCRNLDGNNGSPKAVCSHVTGVPTRSPTVPTSSPTTMTPTTSPTKSPTLAPTLSPSRSPTTLSPTVPTSAPTYRYCNSFNTVKACCGAKYAAGTSTKCVNNLVVNPPGCK